MKENPSESIFDFEDEQIELQRYLVDDYCPKIYYEVDAKYASSITVNWGGDIKIDGRSFDFRD